MVGNELPYNREESDSLAFWSITFRARSEFIFRIFSVLTIYFPFFERGAHSVGQPKFEIETHAPKALAPGLTMERFPDLQSCRDYVHSRGGELIGVEIMDGARNIDEEPFSGTCAFMLGNEVSTSSISDSFLNPLELDLIFPY